MTLTAKQEDIIEGYLAPSERIEKVHADGQPGAQQPDRIIVLTDRRLLRLKQLPTDREYKQTAESLFYTGPDITGVTVDQTGSETPDQSELILGGGLAAIGGLAFLGGLAAGGEAAFFALPGLLFLAIGGYILYDALQTESGGVKVTVASTGGSSSMWLPESAGAFGEAISREVGAAHPRQSSTRAGPQTSDPVERSTA